MADNFSTWETALESPGVQGEVVTPHDSTDLTRSTRGLYIGVGGDVTVVFVDDPATAITFTDVPSGVILPIRVNRVNATATTATNMVGLS